MLPDHSSLFFDGVCDLCRTAVTRVIDGDTVMADLQLVLGLVLQQQRLRLLGIDCPEIHTKDAVEKERGLQAKHYVEDKSPQLLDCIVHVVDKDNFGRWLVYLYYKPTADSDYVSLNNELLVEGHAVEWQKK